MKVIYKYIFADEMIVQLPANADIIKATKDNFWAIVDDTEKEMLELKCVVWGTGWPLPEDVDKNWIYLDTFFEESDTPGHPFVWHHYLVLREND